MITSNVLKVYLFLTLWKAGLSFYLCHVGVYCLYTEYIIHFQHLKRNKLLGTYK